MSRRITSMTKKDLLESLGYEWRLLEATLAGLTPEQMLLSGVAGEWSVKDLLAHITAWQKQMIRWTEALVQGGNFNIPAEVDIDRINADWYTRLKDKLLDEVVQEFQDSHQAALALVEGLHEGQLQTLYTDSWPTSLLWRGVAANTFFHYKMHRLDIQEWLKKQSGMRRNRSRVKSA